jgi:hypothetical protein
MSREMLPDELMWEEGHASELAISALADGEEAIVPATAREHVDACAACTARLGGAALLSMQTSRAIGELGPLLRITPVPAASEGSKAARRGLPVHMLGAALAIAAMGALPTLVHLPTRVAELCVALLHALPTLSRGSVHLLQNGLGPMWLAATCVCAVLFLMTSVAVTRLLPKPVSQ